MEGSKTGRNGGRKEKLREGRKVGIQKEMEVEREQ